MEEETVIVIVETSIEEPSIIMEAPVKEPAIISEESFVVIEAVSGEVAVKEPFVSVVIKSEIPEVPSEIPVVFPSVIIAS